MKNAFVLLLFVSMLGLAQEKTYQIPESKLTEQQKMEIASQTPTSVADVKNWVGVGKEVGSAINDSLSAVTAQANNFAQTPVGKLTVLVVIFKVIGDPAIHILIGLLEILILMPLWVWSYRKYLPRRVITQIYYGENGKVTGKTFGNLPLEDEADVWRGVHLGGLAVIAIVVLSTLFSY